MTDETHQYGHIQRMIEGDLVKIAWQEMAVGKKPPRKAEEGRIKEDGKQVDLSAASDRPRWWMLT